MTEAANPTSEGPDEDEPASRPALNSFACEPAVNHAIVQTIERHFGALGSWSDPAQVKAVRLMPDRTKRLPQVLVTPNGSLTRNLVVEGLG